MPILIDCEFWILKAIFRMMLALSVHLEPWHKFKWMDMFEFNEIKDGVSGILQRWHIPLELGRQHMRQELVQFLERICFQRHQGALQGHCFHHNSLLELVLLGPNTIWSTAAQEPESRNLVEKCQCNLITPLCSLYCAINLMEIAKDSRFDFTQMRNRWFKQRRRNIGRLL